MESLPIGSLVSQLMNKNGDVRRYGVVLRSKPYINTTDTMLHILWQLHSKFHAVSNLAYTEHVLVCESEKMGRPIELVKRMPNV